jgi:glycosyltransferase involved in cell wall biosynthesis
MKILHIIDSLHAGGTERQLVELLKALQQDPKVECELAVLDKDIHFKELLETKIKIHFLDKQAIQFSLMKQIFQICKTFKPDILHTWSYKPTRLSIPIVKILNIKLINGSIRYAKSIRRFSNLWWNAKISFLFSDMIIANSKAGLLVHHLKESNKIKYIYNGFDFNRIPLNQPGSKGNKNLKNVSYQVVMVANFIMAKDQNTLIEAGQEILKKRKDIHFLFIGDGPFRNKVEETVKPELKGYFKFLGKRKEVEELLAPVDIGILLSKEGHAEGLSNTIMEYMAMAKPVIATRVGGNPELVKDNETGFLIPHQDRDALVHRIQQLLEDPGLRAEMGTKGHDRIKQSFSMKQMVSNYREIYQNLTTG